MCVLVGEFLSQLPSLPKPKARLKPIRRLLALAAALAVDGLVEDPDTQAREHLYSVLDGQLAQHRTKVDDKVDDILTAELIRYKAGYGGGDIEEAKRKGESDAGTVGDEYRKAKRALSVAVANGYVKHLLAADDDLDPLQARATTAALVDVAGVERVEDEAEIKTNEWLDSTYSSTVLLSDERQDVYRELRQKSREPRQENTQRR